MLVQNLTFEDQESEDIVNGKVETKIYEDDKVLAFADRCPQAPVHILIIPKKHIKSLDDVSQEDIELLGHIQYIASKIAKEKNLIDGYRLVNNCGVDGGQTVAHIHYHLLGGRTFGWPPG